MPNRLRKPWRPARHGSGAGRAVRSGTKAKRRAIRNASFQWPLIAMVIRCLCASRPQAQPVTRAHRHAFSARLIPSELVSRQRLFELVEIVGRDSYAHQLQVKKQLMFVIAEVFEVVEQDR